GGRARAPARPPGRGPPQPGPRRSGMNGVGGTLPAMTETAEQATAEPTTTPEAAPEPSPAQGADAAAPLFDAERRATELAILDALRSVVDPEIGMNVVELALINAITVGETKTR